MDRIADKRARFTGSRLWYYSIELRSVLRGLVSLEALSSLVVSRFNVASSLNRLWQQLPVACLASETLCMASYSRSDRGSEWVGYGRLSLALG